MRICGECRACCYVFPLPALGKTAGQWCRHAGPGGCAVHDRGQPEVCRRYACYWLENEDLTEDSRPDLVGMVATDCGSMPVGGYNLRIVVISLLRADSDRAPAARAMIEGFTAAGIAVLLIHGPDMRVAYDQARYPAIGQEDVEAAFRYERSRDAEELRRLGAVEEGFRPLSERAP